MRAPAPPSRSFGMLGRLRLGLSERTALRLRLYPGSADALAVKRAKTRVDATRADKGGDNAPAKLRHRADRVPRDGELLENGEGLQARHLGKGTDEVRTQVEGAKAVELIDPCSGLDAVEAEDEGLNVAEHAVRAL